MANTSSAKKAIRRESRERVKNLRRHRARRDARKDVEQAIKDGDKKAATSALQQFTKATAKAAKSGGPLHKNTAARLTSRMAKKVDAAFNQQ